MSDVDSEIAAVRDEMATSRGDQAPLTARLEELYKQKYPEPGAPGPTPRRDGYEDQPQPTMTALIEARLEGAQLADLQAERAKFGNTSEYNAALDTEISDLQKKKYDAIESYAPEPGPTPTTVTFAEGTEEPVKNAFCALALEHNVPRSEAQGVLDSMKAARWLTPEQFRAEMAAEWGEQYAALAALADRTLEQLPFRLRDAVIAREANDTRFSPEVARALVAWAKRQRGGK